MKRILFVDDEKNVLEGVRRMMHGLRSEWQMEFVATGQEALVACEFSAFDVVVSDLRMPGMNGAELLGHIRSRYPATGRIILSGYSEMALTARAVPVAYRVLAKPCNPIDLKEAIDRVCTLQDVLAMPELRRLIGSIGELPSLSETYLALNQQLCDEQSTIASIVQIIERDVAMAAKILHIVNSGFFGISQRATNLEHAVCYLGIDTIRTLALCSETFRVFDPQSTIPVAFWQKMQRHARNTTLIAGTLPLTRAEREVTLIASLLHDVGTLVLASVLPEKFSSILAEMKQSGRSQVEVEEALLGISHAEIGAYLLGLWGINRAAIEAIAHHHHPRRIVHKGLDCSAAVYLANLLATHLDPLAEGASGDALSDEDTQNLEHLGVLDQYPLFCARALECLRSKTDSRRR